MKKISITYQQGFKMSSKLFTKMGQRQSRNKKQAGTAVQWQDKQKDGIET